MTMPWSILWDIHFSFLGDLGIPQLIRPPMCLDPTKRFHQNANTRENAENPKINQNNVMSLHRCNKTCCRQAPDDEQDVKQAAYR